MYDTRDLGWLPDDEVKASVRRQSGDEGATIISWTWDQLVGGGGEAIGEELAPLTRASASAWFMDFSIKRSDQRQDAVLHASIDGPKKMYNS